MPGCTGWSAQASAYASNICCANSSARCASSSTSRSDLHGPGEWRGAAARRTVATVRRYVRTSLESCGTAASILERSSTRGEGGPELSAAPPTGGGGCEGVAVGGAAASGEGVSEGASVAGAAASTCAGGGLPSGGAADACGAGASPSFV